MGVGCQLESHLKHMLGNCSPLVVVAHQVEDSEILVQNAKPRRVVEK